MLPLLQTGVATKTQLKLDGHITLGVLYPNTTGAPSSDLLALLDSTQKARVTSTGLRWGLNAALTM